MDTNWGKLQTSGGDHWKIPKQFFTAEFKEEAVRLVVDGDLKKMKNVALFIMLGVLVFGLTACTKKVDEGTGTNKKGHEAGKSKTPMADSMKKMKLNGYQEKTVGEAFDGYTKAVACEWQEVVGRDNRSYIDYICWFDEKSVLPEHRKQAIVKRGIDIKFVVSDEGKANIAMATKLFMKADGQIQSHFFKVEELPNVVKSIYENKNVEF